jgi:hypothetical protein
MKAIYIIISDILVFILELIISFICITRKYKIDTKLQKLEYYKNKFTPYIIKYQILGGIR